MGGLALLASGSSRISGFQPCRESSVQDRNLEVTQVAQAPPKAGSIRSSGTIIGYDHGRAVDAEPREDYGQGLGRRKRMATILAVARCRQVPLEIGVDCAWDMGLEILGLALERLTQFERAINDGPHRIVEMR